MQRRRSDVDRLGKLPNHLLDRHPTRTGQVERPTGHFRRGQRRRFDTFQEVVDVNRMPEIVAPANVEKAALAQ